MKLLFTLLALVLLSTSATAAPPADEFMRAAVNFQVHFRQDANAVYAFRSSKQPLLLNLFSLPGLAKGPVGTVWQGAFSSSKAILMGERGAEADIVFYNPMTDVAFVSRWLKEESGPRLTVFMVTTGNRLRGETLIKYDGEPYWDYTIRHPQGDGDIDFTQQPQQTATALVKLKQKPAMDALIALAQNDAPQPFTKGTTTNLGVAFARSYAAIIGLAGKVNSDPEGLRKLAAAVTSCLRDTKVCDEKLAGGVTLTGVADPELMLAAMGQLNKPASYYEFKGQGDAVTELYVFVNPLMPGIVVQAWLEKGLLSKVNVLDYDAIMARASAEQ